MRTRRLNIKSHRKRGSVENSAIASGLPASRLSLCSSLLTFSEGANPLVSPLQKFEEARPDAGNPTFLQSRKRQEVFKKQQLFIMSKNEQMPRWHNLVLRRSTSVERKPGNQIWRACFPQGISLFKSGPWRSIKRCVASIDILAGSKI